jgi:cytochrome c oxidase assembly protein subunit 15
VVIRRQESEGSVRAAWVLAGTVVVQLAVGMINLGLLAPVPLQLIHLFFADALWIAFVVLAAEWFVGVPAPETRPLPEFAERA